MSHINDNEGYEFEYYMFGVHLLRKNCINMWEHLNSREWVYVRLTDTQTNGLIKLTKEEAFLEMI